MNKFEQLVWQMRMWQERFATDRSGRTLEQVKLLEQAVDKHLENITQPELFG